MKSTLKVLLYVTIDAYLLRSLSVRTIIGASAASPYLVISTSTLSVLYVKTFPKCLSLGMAQGSTKKSRNKKMAYIHHNDAMTSAHSTMQFSIYGALVMASL